MKSRNKLKHLYSHFFRTLGIYLTVVALAGISLTIIYFNQVNQSRKTTKTSAQETKSNYKLLTYNIHGSFMDNQNGRSKEAIVQELNSLASYIKNNQMDLVALQEVSKTTDTDGGDHFQIDDIRVLQDELNRIGYPMFMTRNTNEAKLSSGSKTDRLFTAFFHKQDDIASMYRQTENKYFPSDRGGSSIFFGFSSIVIDTPLGRIRFINLHPFPDIARPVSGELVNYVNSLKFENIPMVLMGDFNMRFGPAELQGDYKQYVDAIYNAGFTRSCNPVKFPFGNCDDTVTSDTEEYAIDQILIDNRALFWVENAYVDRARIESDHLPVYAVFSNQPANTPSPTRIPTQVVIPPTSTPALTPTLIPSVTKTPTTAFTPIPTKTGIPTNTPSPLPPPVCSQQLGDLSCDGVVGALDVGCWAYQFRNEITKLGCRQGDLNNDKKIDILDFSILKTQVGK